ncbi:siroheme synthase [Niveomyces insectorum RCEF 264]|uniref:precorrin-2 dehydrogenase n=1 Tax=Niveomyces insectorum RCEF 264 TaxID=1081102 RepID=A0A167ULG3_9HYPO|nr:siroheme synthase [Niveomyces insectorum RCEF 264]
MSYHASLLTAVDSREHVHLVVGANPLAATRCSQSLAVGARPVLVTPAASWSPDGNSSSSSSLPAALQARVDAGEVRWVREPVREQHLFTLGRESVGHVVDAVFVTEHDDDRPRKDNDADDNDMTGTALSAAALSAICRRHRIPVNVVDRPALCSFTLLATHRDGPLQIGVTTNGSGCQLAARIRREVAAALPAGLGDACVRLGGLRRRLQAEDKRRQEEVEEEGEAGGEETEERGEDKSEKKTFPEEALPEDDHDRDQPAAFNRLVTASDPAAAKTRRIRWLAQIRPTSSSPTSSCRRACSTSSRAARPSSSPASSRATPTPRRRSSSRRPSPPEVLRLQEAGFAEATRTLLVLPGLTSALTAPLCAGIPPTHRATADQVLVCTGTGQRGQPPRPAWYRPARTAVFLMALHRIVSLVAELTTYTEEEEQEAADKAHGTKPRRALWPIDTPCAVIERASCPDQKVIRTTLAHVVAAVEQEGSRPPGLLVVGTACGVLHAVPGATAKANVTVAVNGAANGAVNGAATGAANGIAAVDKPWTVEEGFNGFDVDDGFSTARLAEL